jgi:hypothetical protein
MNSIPFYPQREFYVVGGTMPHDAPSYVERQADNDLFAALMRGEFCYLLTARQMGKSSLMIRTVTRLRAAGITVAALDLTVIGQNLPTEKWYGGLLVQIGQRLGLEDELIEFWSTQPLLGPMQRWIRAIRTVVLGLPARRLTDCFGQCGYPCAHGRAGTHGLEAARSGQTAGCRKSAVALSGADEGCATGMGASKR